MFKAADETQQTLSLHTLANIKTECPYFLNQKSLVTFSLGQRVKQEEGTFENQAHDSQCFCLKAHSPHGNSRDQNVKSKFGFGNRETCSKMI